MLDIHIKQSYFDKRRSKLIIRNLDSKNIGNMFQVEVETCCVFKKLYPKAFHQQMISISLPLPVIAIKIK